MEYYIHPDYQFNIDLGCIDYSNRLGFVKMPENFALLLNSDQSHFFGMNKLTGTETEIHWNKWAIYRWAKKQITPTKQKEPS